MCWSSQRLTLFLKIQCTFSVLSLSGTTVISLSWPNPALTKALTKVEARFWRAESTAGPAGARPSVRWDLYTYTLFITQMASKPSQSAPSIGLSACLANVGRDNPKDKSVFPANSSCSNPNSQGKMCREVIYLLGWQRHVMLLLLVLMPQLGTMAIGVRRVRSGATSNYAPKALSVNTQCLSTQV